MSVSTFILSCLALLLANIFLFTKVAEALRARSDGSVLLGCIALLSLLAANSIIGKFLYQKTFKS